VNGVSCNRADRIRTCAMLASSQAFVFRIARKASTISLLPKTRLCRQSDSTAVSLILSFLNGRVVQANWPGRRKEGEMQSPKENIRETADDHEPDKPGRPTSHVNIHADRFNILWLRRDQELTPIQRLGFALWSCIFSIPGVACILGVISEKDSAAWIAIPLLLLGVGCLYVGGRGLIVALTAPHKARGTAR
jgi:hypothetical protein